MVTKVKGSVWNTTDNSMDGELLQLEDDHVNEYFNIPFQSPAAWYTIGPTGSGADTIWTYLDDVPENATSIICEFIWSWDVVSPNHSNNAMRLYSANWDTVTPLAANYTAIVNEASQLGSQGTNTLERSKEVRIPTGGDNKFQLYCDPTHPTGSPVTSFVMYAKGYTLPAGG